MEGAIGPVVGVGLILCCLLCLLSPPSISTHRLLQIHAVFGSGLKAYGEDFGARNEGRRYFVPEYTYTDDWDGQTYTR